MELPHLGKNCALKQCNQLDFLPVKCDACSEIFCLRHYQYDTHNCENARNKDVQVPACPLCSGPVACRKDQSPDLAVSEHMDRYCKRNELIKDRLAKPKTNLQACSFKSCRQKDLIYLECRDCQSKFCIKHRYPTDHLCPGPSLTAATSANWQSFKGSCSSGASSGFELLKNKAQQISKSGQAALNRMAASGSNRPSTSNQRAAVSALQGNLNEQEALAIALSESKRNVVANGRQQTPSQSRQQEDEDLALARALHESQLEVRSNRGTSGGTNKDTCILS